MKDFLTFRRMIAPVFVQFLFWLGILGCVGAGIFFLATAEGEQKLIGAALLFAGPIVWRLYCEVLILGFRINNTLTDIRNNTAARAAAPRPIPVVRPPASALAATMAGQRAKLS